MRELGSEFWTIDLQEKENNLEHLNIGKDYKLVMSGRTAIDYILNEIEDNKKIVYMPDYCCESMITPFIDNGYKIEYYKTNLINNRYEIDTNFECSIFFAMNYFGYSSSNMDEYIEKFSKRNIIVIEDITHRLLCEKNHCNQSTYLVGSLRKWFPVLSGGIAVNLREKFKNNLEEYTVNEEFIRCKKQAMQLKSEYINNINTNCKEEFLELFKKSNRYFLDYKNRKIDNESLEILNRLDIDDIRKRRIDNAKTIEKSFKNTNNIRLLYKYKEGDCPLFVPIITNNRDDVRNKLIKNNIYCPIHWPKFNNSNNELYEKELSLICDPRYSKKEMEELVKIIFKNQ